MNDLPKIDYSIIENLKKQMNIKELQIFIYLKKNKILDYETYVMICELYGYEYELTEQKFFKWFKDYEKNLNKRIKGFAEKSSLHIQYIRKELFDGDEVAIARLMKDSTRQSLYEAYSIEHIKNNYPFIYKIKKLKDTGKDALYIYNNRIINGIEKLELALEEETTKSIDFMWEYHLLGCDDKILRFYVSHKYTKEGGGEQDKQHKEIKDFLKITRNMDIENQIFVSITDGDYYIKNRKSGKTKLQELKDVCITDKVLATTTNDLVYDMAPYIIRWLRENFEEEEIEYEIEKLSEFIREEPVL